MGKRREARERALQFLFQFDVNRPENLDDALDHFWTSQQAAALAEERNDQATGPGLKPPVPPPDIDDIAVRDFADPLIRGVIEHRDVIDGHIRKHSHNWDMHRMAVVDRNVMRLAIFEMLHRLDIPPVVSINEAVDVAKKFSTPDSGRFVNGILDKVRGEILRPAREAT